MILIYSDQHQSIFCNKIKITPMHFMNFGFPIMQMYGRHSPPINYTKQFKVYSPKFAFRQDIEKGDKILLPQSSLGELQHLMSKGPLVFCITNTNLPTPKLTYCGVLQFVQDQGICFIPTWMFTMLKFVQGQICHISLVQEIRNNKNKIPYFIKIRPHQTQFIKLDNPKAVLQYQLRNFTCLHQGDTIPIIFHKVTFNIDILEIKPKNDYNAICIVGADVQVDFAPPLDYQQTTPQENVGKFVQKSENKSVFDADKGIRIDGKVNKNPTNTATSIMQEQYDPRKHRIHRGVRKDPLNWDGKCTKISEQTKK